MEVGASDTDYDGVSVQTSKGLEVTYNKRNGRWVTYSRTTKVCTHTEGKWVLLGTKVYS